MLVTVGGRMNKLVLRQLHVLICSAAPLKTLQNIAASAAQSQTPPSFTATIFLTCLPDSLDVPDSPEDLRLSERQNRTVRLSWVAGSSNNSPINGKADSEAVASLLLNK